MASRSRGYSQAQSHDWDPMRDDYDNSTYDQQYQDDDSGEQVVLNHSRLYVTGIPKGLNEEGLRAAFSKYGSLVECYVSRDPSKRYALITYESPAEARNAMMKLNRTEPLKLNVSISHEKRKSSTSTQKLNTRDSNSNSINTNVRSSHRDDVSVSSRTRTTSTSTQKLNTRDSNSNSINTNVRSSHRDDVSVSSRTRTTR